MSEFYFIVNPVAGSGKAKEKFDVVQALLKARGIPYRFDYTARRLHASDLAHAAVERGEKYIICAGGDGTAREVASALIHTDVIMGILPFGTGNDFATAIYIPLDPQAAVEVLLSDNVKKVDAATANGIPFLNVAGTGFDVDVIVYTEKFKKRFNGMLPYMLGVFQSLLHLSPMNLTIEANGETYHEKALLFDACNGSRFGGGMHLAPLASPQDGLLDICVLRAVSIPRFLYLLPKYIKGRHLEPRFSRHFLYFKAQRVFVTSNSANMLDMDGELDSFTPATFQILPHALNMLLPPKGSA